MAKLPKRAAERIAAGLKRYQPILASAKLRDVNESDTVLIVTDLLQEVFGYDKFSEVTSEHMIKGTYCDLAVKLDGALAFLIEVKAIGLDLKENFVKQAVDYAANQGVEWVVLTSGARWCVYKVSFSKPIAHEVVVDMDLLTMSHKNSEHIELIGLLSREGWLKAHLGDFFSHKQVLNRFTLGALLLSDQLLDVLRRQIRRMSPETRADPEDIKSILEAEVLKREVLEGDKAQAARKQVAKAAGKRLANAKAELGEASVVASVDAVPTNIER